jgi:hypothetical protein
MTVFSARADVPTETPGRYAKQLLSHLGHRVTWATAGDTSTAQIAGGTGSIVVGDGRLTLIAEASDAETLTRSSTSSAATWSDSPSGRSWRSPGSPTWTAPPDPRRRRRETTSAPPSRLADHGRRAGGWSRPQSRRALVNQAPRPPRWGPSLAPLPGCPEQARNTGDPGAARAGHWRRSWQR